METRAVRTVQADAITRGTSRGEASDQELRVTHADIRHRELVRMMIDEDMDDLSPSTVYRIRLEENLMNRNRGPHRVEQSCKEHFRVKFNSACLSVV